MGYVLAVSCSTAVPTAAGRFPTRELAERLPWAAWQPASARAGVKGQRLYDWALVATTEAGPGHRSLLIRRNRATDELTYYRLFTRVGFAWGAGGRGQDAVAHRGDVPADQGPGRSR